MKRIVPMAVVLAASVTVLGGYSDDFREAKKLFAQGEYAEAADAFAQLAETAPKEYAKVWSLSYAARALGQGGQYEEAIEAIQSSPMAAYTRMEIMSAAGKHAELAEAFRDEAGMAAWPDEINYKCFYLRGLARATSDDNQDAVDDFNQCVELAGSDTETKLDALGQQAGLLAGLGEEDKALAAYEKAFALFDRRPRWRGRWLYPRTILRAVALLSHPDKFLLYMTGAGATELPTNIEEFPDNILVRPSVSPASRWVLETHRRALTERNQKWFEQMGKVRRAPAWDHWLSYRTPTRPRYPVVFTVAL